MYRENKHAPKWLIFVTVCGVGRHGCIIRPNHVSILRSHRPRNAEDVAAITCLHCSSNCDEVEELHNSSEELEAHPYRTIFSEELYFRRMACRSMTQAYKRGRRKCYG